jgi:uncharacterized peroxidase-related enzyme
MDSGETKSPSAPTTAVSADPHAANMQRLVDAVLAGAGTLDPSVRRAAAEGAHVPEALRGYLDKVTRHAYKVTDEDVDALREAGYSEDQIFEATVSCALGACLRRLDAGLSAIQTGAWMRLKRVETGHRLPQRLMLRAMRLTGRMEPPDVVKTSLYRREFFGRPYGVVLHRVMRGPSEWAVGERELFAAFTSKLNQCPFWTGAHGAVASEALGQELTQAVLEDWRTAPIDEKLRATLAFLEKVTLSPHDVRPEDTALVHQLGVSDAAIRDAVYVCALFNMLDRISDALDFSIPTAEGFKKGAKMLLRFGYRLPA